MQWISVGFLFIKHQGTFRPERLADIARRYGLNEEAGCRDVDLLNLENPLPFAWNLLMSWFKNVEVLRLPTSSLAKPTLTGCLGKCDICSRLQCGASGPLPWGETVDTIATRPDVSRLKGYIDKSNEYISIIQSMRYISYIISKSKFTATWSDWFLTCRVCSLEGRVTNRNWLCWQD